MDLLTAIKEKRKNQALTTEKEVELTNGATVTVKKLGFMQRKQCTIDAYKKLNIPITDDLKPDLSGFSYGGFEEVDFAENVELIRMACPSFSDKKMLKELGFKNVYEFMENELEEEDFTMLGNAIIELAKVEIKEREAVEEAKKS